MVHSIPKKEQPLAEQSKTLLNLLEMFDYWRFFPLCPLWCAGKFNSGNLIIIGTGGKNNSFISEVGFIWACSWHGGTYWAFLSFSPLLVTKLPQGWREQTHVGCCSSNKANGSVTVGKSSQLIWSDLFYFILAQMPILYSEEMWKKEPRTEEH